MPFLGISGAVSVSIYSGGVEGFCNAYRDTCGPTGKGDGEQQVEKRSCAAKAFYDCPAIISHRPRSQNILKEPALNPEKDSRRKRARSHVSLEKSSQNYKPLDK